jgi:hypothetical protein
MPIKISQLPELTVVDSGTLFSTVDTTDITPVSKKSTALTVANYILSGNAATATKLAATKNINGVAFDGSTDITIIAPIPAATASELGGIKVGANLSIDPVTGVLSAGNSYVLPAATSGALGGIKVGAGITVAVDGTLSAPTRKFHGFSVNGDGALIYSTTEDSTISLQDSTGADIYEDVDIGTNEYSYSMDANGNLIVTYS